MHVAAEMFCSWRYKKNIRKAEHVDSNDLPYRGSGTPKDYIAMLCIELFKQGRVERANTGGVR